MFSVSPLLRDPLTQTQTLDDRLALMAWPAAFLAIAVAIVLAMRATLMRTAINRRFVGSLLLALFSQVAVHVGGALMELPIAAVHTVLFGLWFCISAMMTIALNGRLVYGTLGYLAGFFISARWPELRFYAMSASNLLMTINCTALWLSQRAAHEPAPPPARDR